MDTLSDSACEESVLPLSPPAKRQRTGAAGIDGLPTPSETLTSTPAAQSLPHSTPQHLHIVGVQLPESPASTTSITSTRSRPKSYTCPECSKSFTRPCKLDEHERTHTGERPFICMYPGCGKSYMRDTHLAVHARTHDPEQKRKYRCTVDGCSKGFATNQHLKRHIKCHELPTPFACTYEGCSQAFAKKHQLHLHLCAHTGESPYKCDVGDCRESFKYPSQLKRHKMSHSTETRYICAHEGCTEKFAKWSELQGHVKEAHRGEPHKCHLCEATFKRRHALTLHLLRHDPDRLVYMCPHEGCGRFYLDMSSLNAHARTVHETDGPRFACPHSSCGKTYIYAHSLRSHISKTHQAAPAEDERERAEDGAKKEDPEQRRGRQPTVLDIASGMAYSNPEISGRGLLCDVEGCKFRFKRPNELQIHLAAVHGICDLEAIDQIIARASGQAANN